MAMRKDATSNHPRKFITTLFVSMFWFSLSVAVAFGASLDVGKPVSWTGPGGSPIHFDSWEDLENYLATAKVLKVEKIPRGVTKPKKLLLEKDGVKMNAIFRSVDHFRHKLETAKGIKFNLHDFCQFEYASYRLSRLFGIDHVPPVVIRTFEKEDFLSRKDFNRLDETQGTLQAWVEGAMTEVDRQKSNLDAPDRREWFRQLQLLYIYRNLIYNDDLNLGNILIGPDWKIWFIDATRAFRPYGDLVSPDHVKRCSRLLWERLQNVSDEEIRMELEPVLNSRELRTLLERRAKLVELIEERIVERGEARVVVDN